MEYDAKNRPVKESVTTAGNTSVDTYKYDGNDNIVEWSQINGAVVETMNYDNKANYAKIANLPMPIAEAYYMGANNAVGGTYFDRTHTPQNAVIKFELTYDTEGKMEKAARYVDNKLINTVTYNYERY
ncbi:hypothetical protein DYU11_21210 [Fibrisoma montanum]|uniref:RHS repeat-associated core domain-containing protein n=1 Tax=Fibrisoma montanum TaxID=2305895 RepID=A0A418M414_9BACT|nr:hypothetical protein DYU11_21210 [Fibrisoma montanum]